MNTRTSPRRPSSKPQSVAPALAPHFDEMPDPTSVVEHLTVAGFLRRCPHRFHLNEIHRFGGEVGKAAEALGVSYLTTIDQSLGMVRLFPVPLLARVYQILAAQFAWEPMADTPTLEDGRADELRANERARKRLESVVEHIDNPAVSQAMSVVLNWLENDARRLRGEPPTPPAAPVELRPL